MGREITGQDVVEGIVVETEINCVFVGGCVMFGVDVVIIVQMYFIQEKAEDEKEKLVGNMLVEDKKTKWDSAKN